MNKITKIFVTILVFSLVISLLFVLSSCKRGNDNTGDGTLDSGNYGDGSQMSVSINGDEHLSMLVGETITLSATVVPENLSCDWNVIEENLGGDYTFKGGKSRSAHLNRSASQHDLAVKSKEYAGMARCRHGKGRAQIIRSIGEHICQRQLRSGEYHGQIDARQHKGNGGGSVSHGVGAVGNHDAVKSVAVFVNTLGNELPFRRADIGRVQADELLHRNIVIGTQLLHFPFKHTGISRL